MFCSFHLAPEGHIIIYGGSYGDLQLQVFPDTVILNVQVTPYEWIIPNISSKNAPPSLRCHTANLYKNYMILSFGKRLKKIISHIFTFIMNLIIDIIIFR